MKSLVLLQTNIKLQEYMIAPHLPSSYHLLKGKVVVLTNDIVLSCDIVLARTIDHDGIILFCGVLHVIVLSCIMVS